MLIEDGEQLTFYKNHDINNLLQLKQFTLNNFD